MELGVNHEQNLSSLTTTVVNIFDKFNKNLVPIRSLSDHDIYLVQGPTFKCVLPLLPPMRFFGFIPNKESNTWGITILPTFLFSSGSKFQMCIASFASCETFWLYTQ